jgi:transposase
LRWRLHELDPSIDPTPRSLDRASNYDKLEAAIEKADNLGGRLAKRDIQECRRLTIEIDQLEDELRVLTEVLVPTLLEIVGCGTLTAAKLLGEAGGIDRFRSQDAFARHNGTAPLPVWSSNHQRHRLSRTGNRQINTAIHRIALTQIRVHQPAKELYERRKANGNGGLQALRVVKRHLSNTVFQALQTDAKSKMPNSA